MPDNRWNGDADEEEMDLPDSQEYEQMALDELDAETEGLEDAMVKATRAQAYATLALAAATKETAMHIHMEDEEEDEEEEEEEEEDERPPRGRR